MSPTSWEETYGEILGAARRLGTETVELPEALGRVLGQDVVSEEDMPPFDRSTRDGFACRRVDLASDLVIVETIPAGHMPLQAIGPQQCAHIMTGALLPSGADRVVMAEHAEVLPNGRLRVTGPTTEVNICPRGEEFSSGDRVLAAGEIITPAHLALLAMVGCMRPQVARRPRVTVLATGSELVDPHVAPVDAQIRNSNGYQLWAQAQHVGALASHGGIVPDTVEAIDKAVKAAIPGSDLIVLSGGVSTGVYDLVPGVLRDNGFELLLEGKTGSQGRPAVFGQRGNVYCCGLPGNPGACFVAFETLLKPLLFRLMGHAWRPSLLQARLARELRRRASSRQSSILVRFTQPGVVDVVDAHGVASIRAMTGAEALVTGPGGEEILPAGTTVTVQLLR